MQLLYALAKLRTPWLDTVLGAITNCGGEIVFMAVAIIVFWCVSKSCGYYMLTVGFVGTIVNQFLKLVFRIPRPWVKDPDFRIVESARAEATGYSFPSGHTQNVFASFGCLGRWTRRTWLRVVCAVVIVLTAFSRMYLGVHTPLDVGVSFGIGLVLVFALLVLCYMASLLAVMLGLDSDYQSFLGKRALVGSEHVIEALLFIMLACTAHEKRLSPVLGFGLFATLVVAVPQFIASDLMYQTGLLGALSHLDLVVPLVAVASFAIAAVAIGLLVRVSTRAAQAPAMPAGNWQEELCRTALGSLDLSPREFDVAVLAYRGYSAKKIASTLYVSESTVKTHTSHVYRKVGIHSKQELIAFIDAFRTEG